MAIPFVEQPVAAGSGVQRWAGLPDVELGPRRRESEQDWVGCDCTCFASHDLSEWSDTSTFLATGGRRPFQGIFMQESVISTSVNAAMNAINSFRCARATS